MARTDWRLGGRTVRRWREPLLAVALGGLALAMIAAAVIEWAAADSRLPATAVIWAAMASIVVYAFSRSRPAGLLRLRPVDLLYAVGCAVLLRLVQGWVEIGLTGRAPFPAFPLTDARTAADAWLIDGVGFVLIGPVVEELFLRGVVLVTVYNLLRRPLGRTAAAAVSLLASVVVSVLSHVTVADSGGLLAVAGVALMCGLAVLTTGRIWVAVLIHCLFAASHVVLAFVGTVWG